MRKALLTLLGFVISINSISQVTVVSGLITDKSTGDPLPFVSVVFEGIGIGSMSDTNGHYSIQTKKQSAAVLFSSMGYGGKSIKVEVGVSQTLDVQLKSKYYDLAEVIIRPGENPAWEILRRTIARKSQNNPEQKDAYAYDAYHKIRFDLNHFTEKLKRNFYLRPFDFIWENVDTTEEGVAYLPVLLAEKTSEVYFRKSPPAYKENITGSRTKGLEGPRIMEFIDDMYVHPNIYDNYVVILEKSFPSPLNDSYQKNYRFYLVDSLMVGGHHCYKIIFRPKQRHDRAFIGEMLIDKETYAVKQVDLSFSIEANVNFVRNYWVRQKYELVDGKSWAVSSSEVLADFTVVENSSELTGFFGRKTSLFTNYKINKPREDQFFSGVDFIVMADGAENRDEDFWVASRLEPLTQKEKELFIMIDSLESHPQYILLNNTIRTLITGWLPIKNMAIGDIYTFYSYNETEQSRIKLGFKFEDLFNVMNLSGYGAYGFGDEKFKYFGHLNFKFKGPQNRFNKIGFVGKSDINQLGRSNHMIALDHVLTTLIRTAPISKRTLTTSYNAYFERQWFTGLTTRLSAFSESVESYGAMKFVERRSAGILDTVSNYGFNGFELSAKLAIGKPGLSAEFGYGGEAKDIRTTPVLSLSYRQGIKGLLNGEFNMQQLKVRIEQKVRLNKMGHAKYLIELGKIWGDVPFVYLNTPLANQMILNDGYAFNLMNYLEFVSDQYYTFTYEHHFDGLIFDRIPKINSLKLRSFIFVKTYYGSLSSNYLEEDYLLPNNMSGMDEPYYEAGFGIENILKIARIDFSWRLNYHGKEDIYIFMVKPSFYFSF